MLRRQSNKTSTTPTLQVREWISKIKTVGIITAIKSRAEWDLLCIPLICATPTTAVLSSAWIAMLTTLTPPPTRNRRNIICAHFERCSNLR